MNDPYSQLATILHQAVREENAKFKQRLDEIFQKQDEIERYLGRISLRLDVVNITIRNIEKAFPQLFSEFSEKKNDE